MVTYHFVNPKIRKQGAKIQFTSSFEVREDGTADVLHSDSVNVETAGNSGWGQRLRDLIITEAEKIRDAQLLKDDKTKQMLVILTQIENSL